MYLKLGVVSPVFILWLIDLNMDWLYRLIICDWKPLAFKCQPLTLIKGSLTFHELNISFLSVALISHEDHPRVSASEYLLTITLFWILIYAMNINNYCQAATSPRKNWTRLGTSSMRAKIWPRQPCPISLIMMSV